ncbi:hypothetical protein ASPCADRAFT_204876 [Aspergillus carbonarius ITEM 5010]|uniref:Uncharacterized protein n=1 Tax=Aspergillus carbonarius (strain ITEM 5010) TaxID=602072 RepID=A0A1R3RXI3_ASPC5|nr:hypothetical protein ASPCADRAFT_204876 [Aspergillus carbonarius ITEM 5010]
MSRHLLNYYIAARFIFTVEQDDIWTVIALHAIPPDLWLVVTFQHEIRLYHVMMLLAMQSLFQQWSLVICFPVHASNLEGPGNLVPAFHLSTSGTSYPLGGWLTPNHGISHRFALLSKVLIDRVNHLFAMQIANR